MLEPAVRDRIPTPTPEGPMSNGANTHELEVHRVSTLTADSAPPTRWSDRWMISSSTQASAMLRPSIVRVQTIHTTRVRCLSHARSTWQPHLPSSTLPSQTLFADLHPSMSAQAQIDRNVSLATGRDSDHVLEGVRVRRSDGGSVRTSIWSRLLHRCMPARPTAVTGRERRGPG